MRKKIYLLGFLGLVMAVLPIIIFTFFFNSQVVSDNISDWASFGGYIGGTVNTVISVLSFFVLSWLTYLVSDINNKENKKLNILDKKLTAYDELIKFSPEINRRLILIEFLIDKMNYKAELTSDLNDVDYIKAKKELFQNSNFFIDFYYFVFNFNVRYSHIFEYDFNSEDYKLFLESSKQVKDFFYSVIKKFEIDQGEIPNFPDMEIFAERLVIIINELRNEINTTMPE